jgi:branched-chain amino acid transport system permease protein
VATVLIDGLDGLAYAMLLFTVGAGLGLVFGVMNVLNLAHGTLYLAGAYLAALLAGTTTAGLLAAVAVGAAAGAGGGILLAGLLRPLPESGHLEQALLTLGIAFIAEWAFTAGFGGAPLPANPPTVLAGSISVLGHGYPLYPLLLLPVGGLLAIVLHRLLRYSHPGRLLRATIADAGMAAASGIRTGRVRIVALGCGAALAVAGGVLGAPLIGPGPGVDTQILMLSLIVVVLGGAGSIPHTLVAAVVVGLVQAFTVTVPALAPVLLFAAVLAVLVVRGRATTGRLA